jgi:hypothetical protein
LEEFIKELAAEVLKNLKQLEIESNLNRLVLLEEDELRSEALLICNELNNLKEKLSGLM